MVHTGLFCTKAEIDVFVGENVDLTGYIEANINAACKQMESSINCIARHNYSDTVAALNADVKGILALACASGVALQFISYNMGGYTSRVEAEDMLNIAYAFFLKCCRLLKDQKTVTFVNGA